MVVSLDTTSCIEKNIAKAIASWGVAACVVVSAVVSMRVHLKKIELIIDIINVEKVVSCTSSDEACKQQGQHGIWMFEFFLEVKRKRSIRGHGLVLG